MTPKRFARPILGTLLAAGILLSSCSGGGTTTTPATPTPQATGVITGTLRMEVGVLAPPHGGDVPGVVSASGPRGRRYSQHVSPDGRFTLHVVPGTYVLVGRTPRFNGGQAPCGAGAVSVPKGGTVRRDVVCDGP